MDYKFTIVLEMELCGSERLGDELGQRSQRFPAHGGVEGKPEPGRALRHCGNLTDRKSVV